MLWSRKPPARSPSDTLALALFSVIDRTQAVIRFHPDGTIIDANDNFLAAMGYAREEVQGKHHRMFMDPKATASAEYQAFWADLAAGRSFTDQFPRQARGGRIVWIQATYAPVLGRDVGGDLDHLGRAPIRAQATYAPVLGPDGRATQVIKVATDITARQTGIQDIAQGLQALSQGRLTYRTPPCGVAEIDELGQAYNQTMDRLSQALSQVSLASASVDRTARDLGQGAQELARRTEIQAATLEQTVAAIHELTSAVSAASENARDVVRTADEAMDLARGGEKVADDAVGAMSQISKSSGRISHVISVIDDIAFQTNLLALNAGVEAARAGESGRGFAVVASEVRQLAVRSAEAAAEIKLLIEESRGHVSNGVGLVTHAGEELKKIIGGINVIHGKIAEIAHGAGEQATTLSEISSGMTQLDMTTQKNAAMVEESASAAQVLTDHAGALARQVRGFDLGEAQAPPVQARAPVGRAAA